MSLPRYVSLTKGGILYPALPPNSDGSSIGSGFTVLLTVECFLFRSSFYVVIRTFSYFDLVNLARLRLRCCMLYTLITHLKLL